MPETNNQSTVLRRLSRLSHYNGTADPPEPATSKRSEDPKASNSRSRKTRVCSPDPSPSSERGTLSKQTTDFHEKLSKKKGESLTESRNCSNGTTGFERNARVYHRDYGFCTPRRSPRLANLRNAIDEKNYYPDSVKKNSRQSCNKSSSKANLSSGPRSVSSNECVDEVQGLRRSKRLRGLQEVEVSTGNEKCRTYNSRGKKKSTEKSNSNVACEAKRNEKTSCKALRISDESVKKVCVLALKANAEGSNKKEDGDVERKIVGVKREREQREIVDRPIEGWTKEQELALQRAYLVSKPTPHFWKKVAKLFAPPKQSVWLEANPFKLYDLSESLKIGIGAEVLGQVPGKSAQECFNKIHSDYSTPPQVRPQSRAAKFKSSLPNHLSLSASKLLNPTEKTQICRRKSRLSHKTLRHLLQSHHKAWEDNTADLFSILEPNADLPTNGFQSTVVFSTPTQLNGKQGLQNCSQNSSVHKNPLLMSSSSRVTDIVSPPVLKQVKNKVLHEKYIDQLHSREARRKAASAQEVAKMAEQKREGRSTHKVDILRAAKLALVSKARNAISKFQYSQANLMSNEYSLDNDDGASIEDDDNEDESQ